ncbi:MAG TPA: hypothetical protein VLA44_10860, partial [Clostridia bacterium]|nr:hypothetical protein [Clostridia bacterium]
ERRTDDERCLVVVNAGRREARLRVKLDEAGAVALQPLVATGDRATVAPKPDGTVLCELGPQTGSIMRIDR